MAKRDYYEVLGVAKDVDPKAIKTAFRELALKYHPDRNKAPDSEEKFKEIAEAYAVLSDPDKRAQYDTGGLAGMAGPLKTCLGGLTLATCLVIWGLGLILARAVFSIVFFTIIPPAHPEGAIWKCAWWFP
jgi:preprotein translocase subunit Sec63